MARGWPYTKLSRPSSIFFWHVHFVIVLFFVVFLLFLLCFFLLSLELSALCSVAV